MCTTAENTLPMARFVVPNHLRLAAMQRAFGAQACRFEHVIFQMMCAHCEDYSGGYWEFAFTANRGFFMYPTGRAQWRVRGPENMSDERMSPEAAGLTMCMMAYSSLSFDARTQSLAGRHFHGLRDVALTHAEASAIFAVLD